MTEQEFEDYDFQNEPIKNSMVKNKPKNKISTKKFNQKDIDHIMGISRPKKTDFLKYFNGISSFLPMQWFSKKDDEFIYKISGRNDCPNPRMQGFEEMPKDLIDEESFWVQTKDGYPTIGQVMAEEISLGRRSPGLTAYLGFAMFIPLIFIILGVKSLPIIALYYLFLTLYTKHGIQYTLMGIAGMTAYYYALVTGTTMWAHITTAMPALYLVWFLWVDKQIKADVLEYQGKIPTSPSPFTTPVKGRFDQVKNAMRDKSMLIPLGVAMGYFSQYGHPLAPDARQIMGLTTEDFSLNMAIFGEPGSGKTSGAILPIIKGILDEEKATHSNIGILLLDGKGTLAKDCKEALDYIFHPSLVRNFNVLQGLTPEVFATTMLRLNATGNEKDKTWSTAAREMLYYGSVIHDNLVLLGTHKNNFITRATLINQMCSKEDNVKRQFQELMENIKDHPNFSSVGNVLMDALNKYEYEYSNMAPETLSSVQFNVKNWLSPFLQTAKLRAWADSEESDLDIEDILRHGKKVGILLPEAEFGDAGAAYAALVKARLYNLIKLRGNKGSVEAAKFVEEYGYDDFHTVFTIIDEAQIIATEDDVDMAPISRSLGLRIVMATQNIESYFLKFTKEGAEKLLGSLQSKICFDSTEKTLEYMASCIGKGKKYMEYAGKGEKASNFCLSATAQKELSLSKYDYSNSNFGFFTKSRFERREMFFGERFDNAKNKINKHCGTGGYADQAAYADGRALQNLKQPGVALAILMRGGVERVDFMRVNKMNGKFENVQ